MSTNTNAEQRIAELESRLEFQDLTISQLNDELVLHHRRIVDLEKKVKLIISRLPQPDEHDHNPDDEGPPPHY